MSSVKSSVSVRLDPHVLAQLDEKIKTSAEWDNRSQFFQRQAAQFVGSNQSELEEEATELEREIRELKEKIKELEDEKARKQDQFESIQAELKARELAEAEQENELERFREVAETQIEKGDWRNPEDIKDYWPDELDMSKEELWGEIKQEQDMPEIEVEA